MSASQNGLEPTIRVRLKDWVREIAVTSGREAAKAVMEEHVKTCPARARPVNPDNRLLRAVGIRKEFLVGVILGSATVGGFVGGFLQKVIPW